MSDQWYTFFIPTYTSLMLLSPRMRDKTRKPVSHTPVTSAEKIRNFYQR